jgi:hypothetical protein
VAETKFQIVARAPNFWLSDADNLQAGAKVLWEAHLADLTRLFAADFPQGSRPASDFPNTGLHRTSMLLAGLCLENLVKGIRVRQDPTLVREDRFAPSLTRHGLLRLFRDANIAVSQEEESLLERLTAHVVWAGKYSFPKEVPCHDDIKILRSDFETFDKLANRLRGILNGNAF